MDGSPDDQQSRLSPEDERALDALLEQGFDANDANTDSPLARLLALLGTPLDDEQPDVLADLTVLRARQLSSEPELTNRDADALDAWVMHGYDSSKVPAALRDRAQRLDHLAASATALDAGSSDLIERTLAHVQSHIDAEEDRMLARPSAWSRFRLADIVSVAAALLIGVSIIWPAANTVRDQQSRMACASNMQAAGAAMGLYATANHESLPMATASFGGSWLDVGTTPERSNSANLFTLVRTGHVPMEGLACKGNPTAAKDPAEPGQQDWHNLPEVSYSYQIVAGWRPVWRERTEAGEPTIVLADRSPVVRRAVEGKPIDPYAGSPNHGDARHHVLRTDGSAEYLTSPVVDGDNIWLPRVIELILKDIETREGLIRGSERPVGSGDVFLGP
ncbi:MAG: hypothetical protein RIB60_08745 [Phycisphaerales bacterium]